MQKWLEDEKEVEKQSSALLKDLAGAEGKEKN